MKEVGHRTVAVAICIVRVAPMILHSGTWRHAGTVIAAVLLEGWELVVDVTTYVMLPLPTGYVVSVLPGDDLQAAVVLWRKLLPDHCCSRDFGPPVQTVAHLYWRIEFEFVGTLVTRHLLPTNGIFYGIAARIVVGGDAKDGGG